MGTDSGRRSATPRSPALLATHSLYRGASLALTAPRASVVSVATVGRELADPHPAAAPWEELPGQDGEMQGIEEEFRRKIAGLRRLPREAKAHALRAARADREMALRLLRDRRDSARRSRLARRRQMPTPR